MPPKSKRLPHPSLHHLKHSRQLLEDFLYQYLPLYTGMSAISRVNLFVWCTGQWGLSPDGKSGLPFMVLEALRQQRQHLLNQKATIKPLSLYLFGTPEDKLLLKAAVLLQEVNKQSHTATISHQALHWQEVVKQLQVQLQRQPASERNLLILDPAALQLPGLKEVLSLLPKRIDILLLLPIEAILQATGFPAKGTPPAAVAALSSSLTKLLPAPQENPVVTEEKEEAASFQEARKALSLVSSRYTMHHYPPGSTVALYGLSQDALIMEKLLQARHHLRMLAQQHVQAGNQLGLFGSTAPQAPAAPSEEITHLLLLLFSQQPEWDNQRLYEALLQQEILPQQAVPPLLQLASGGKVEVLDEKKKKIKNADSLGLTPTAHKLPAPSRYFRLKE